MIWVQGAFAVALAYLLGSIPMGYLAAKLKGVDVRRVGSGRTGGSNVLRAAGVIPAALTIVSDLLKGFGAVYAAKSLLPGMPLAPALAGLAVVAGHNYSVFLGFDGGVGSMTMLGAALALMPFASLGALGAGALVILIWRYSSLASLVMAVVLPLACVAGRIWGSWPAANILFAVGTTCMSVWELRPNIVRLLKGTERKLGQFIRQGQADVVPH